jgi:uncharacterized protein (DUF433 family)
MMSTLGQGFYTTREAAQLIEIGNLSRIKSWLEGYRKSAAGPLLRRDYEHKVQNAPHELSFYDLMEVRFVEFFRERGVKLNTLRAGLESAREVFNTDKPFATNLIRFTVSKNKKAIYVNESDKQIATNEEDPKLWNLLTRQYEIVQVTHDLIERGIEFDTITNLARYWHPRQKDFPQVVINPFKAYGKPIVGDGTPTQVIYDTWLAENRNIEVIKNWFDISYADAQAAVSFENNLRGEKEGIAA